MKCPVDASHEGIKVEKTEFFKNPHYAKAICAECGSWIKWLSKKQADALEQTETAEPESKKLILLKCVDDLDDDELGDLMSSLKEVIGGYIFVVMSGSLAIADREELIQIMREVTTEILADMQEEIKGGILNEIEM